MGPTGEARGPSTRIICALRPSLRKTMAPPTSPLIERPAPRGWSRSTSSTTTRRASPAQQLRPASLGAGQGAGSSRRWASTSIRTPRSESDSAPTACVASNGAPFSGATTTSRRASGSSNVPEVSRSTLPGGVRASEAWERAMSTGAPAPSRSRIARTSTETGAAPWCVLIVSSARPGDRPWSHAGCGVRLPHATGPCGPTRRRCSPPEEASTVTSPAAATPVSSTRSTAPAGPMFVSSSSGRPSASSSSRSTHKMIVGVDEARACSGAAAHTSAPAARPAASRSSRLTRASPTGSIGRASPIRAARTRCRPWRQP